jgi:methionine-rich copper-binding protein CopC
MRRPLSFALGLALALLGSVPPAMAHGELLRATPQPGSIVATSPSDVRVQFSEGIEARFSGLEVAASNGKRVPIGRPQVQGTAMAVPIAKPLPPGVYRVNWRVLSVDGHKTQGSFTFEVRP